MTEPTTTNGASCHAMLRSRPAREPTAQKRNWSSVRTSSSRIAVVRDPTAEVMAAPARASLTGVAPSRPSDPSAYTTTAVTAAPAKENQTYPSSEVTPNA